MNPKLKELRDRIEATNAQIKDLCDKAETDDRDLTDDENRQYLELKTDRESLETRAARIEAEDEAAHQAVIRARASNPLQAEAALDPVVHIEPKGVVIEEDEKRGFANIGDFSLAVYNQANNIGAADERLQIMTAATGLNQSSGTDGGFLVPPEFSTAIWDGLVESPDSLLAMTDSYPVTGESLTFNANAETSRANGSRYGGIRAYWLAEADQITSSKPTFRQIRVEPQELAVLVYVTDKLLRNTSALDSYITRAAIEEINFLIGDSIINGTGAGQPLGILNASGTVSVAKETGQVAATLVFENVLKMFSRCHSRSRNNAVWFINQDIEPQLQTMTLDIGTGGAPVYLPPGGASAAPYGMLLNRPVMPIEYCSTIGTKGDIILGDMKAYVTGVQGGIRSDMSIHLRFDYAETAFRFMFAVDGKPWLASALTPFKGNNTLSPHVTLATRA